MTATPVDVQPIEGEVVDGTVGTEIVKLKPRLVEAAALFQSDIDDGSPGVRSSVVPDGEFDGEASGVNMMGGLDLASQDWYGISGNARPQEGGSSSQPPSMDDLLNECFCIAVKTSISKDDLPMLTSTFYRSHMMPLCPPEYILDVKKSKHKKLSKFLSALQSEGVLKVSEISKGVESITEIDFKHPMVKGIVPRYVIKKAATGGESSSASATNAAVSQLIITELFIPTHKVLPIFRDYGYSTSSMMTHSGVREVVTTYIRERELVSPTDSKIIVLDPMLTDAVLRKGEPPPTQLSWQQIITRVLEEMRPGYSIQRNDENLVYKRTKLEPVRLSVTTRTGNKKATLVDNLEYYGIAPTDIVHQVQRIAAASATVNDVSGRPPRQQVMVQGNNVKIIAKLLQEQHGLPLKYIEAMDKTKAPKTHKRPGGKR